MDPINQQQTPPAPKKKFGCLKIFLIFCAFCLVCILIIGIMVVNSVRWLSNAPEKARPQFAPLNLSQEEQEEVAKIAAKIYFAPRDGATVDFTISPRIVNGLIEFIINEDKKKGKKNADAIVRCELADDLIRLRFSVPAEDKDGMYVNGEAELAFDIVENKIQNARVRKVALHDQEAPLLVRMTMNLLVRAANESARERDENIRAIKLFRREGDKLHFVLDGKEMKKPQELEAEETPNNKKAPVPKETEF